MKSFGSVVRVMTRPFTKSLVVKGKRLGQVEEFASPRRWIECNQAKATRRQQNIQNLRKPLVRSGDEGTTTRSKRANQLVVQFE